MYIYTLIHFTLPLIHAHSLSHTVRFRTPNSFLKLYQQHWPTFYFIIPPFLSFSLYLLTHSHPLIREYRPYHEFSARTAPNTLSQIHFAVANNFFFLPFYFIHFLFFLHSLSLVTMDPLYYSRLYTHTLMKIGTRLYVLMHYQFTNIIFFILYIYI